MPLTIPAKFNYVVVDQNQIAIAAFEMVEDADIYIDIVRRSEGDDAAVLYEFDPDANDYVHAG